MTPDKKREFLESVGTMLKHDPIMAESVSNLFKSLWDDDDTRYEYGPVHIGDAADYQATVGEYPEYDYSINITDEAKAEIESLVPGFITLFNSYYRDTCHEKDVSACFLVETVGSEASWDGHDFGSYDPGWSEDKTELACDINDVLEEIKKQMYNDDIESLTDVPQDEVEARINKCFEILDNRDKSKDIY